MSADRCFFLFLLAVSENEGGSREGWCLFGLKVGSRDKVKTSQSIITQACVGLWGEEADGGTRGIGVRKWRDGQQEVCLYKVGGECAGSEEIRITSANKIRSADTNYRLGVDSGDEFGKSIPYVHTAATPTLPSQGKGCLVELCPYDVKPLYSTLTQDPPRTARVLVLLEPLLGPVTRLALWHHWHLWYVTKLTQNLPILTLSSNDAAATSNRTSSETPHVGAEMTKEVHTSTTTHHTNHLLIDLEIELIRLVTGKRAHTFIYLPIKSSEGHLSQTSHSESSLPADLNSICINQLPQETTSCFRSHSFIPRLNSQLKKQRAKMSKYCFAPHVSLAATLGCGEKTFCLLRRASGIQCCCHLPHLSTHIQCNVVEEICSSVFFFLHGVILCPCIFITNKKYLKDQSTRRSSLSSKIRSHLQKRPSISHLQRSSLSIITWSLIFNKIQIFLMTNNSSLTHPKTKDENVSTLLSDLRMIVELKLEAGRKKGKMCELAISSEVNRIEANLYTIIFTNQNGSEPLPRNCETLVFTPFSGALKETNTFCFFTRNTLELILGQSMGRLEIFVCHTISGKGWFLGISLFYGGIINMLVRQSNHKVKI
ncbi:putative signal peptide protein [Puccinia sorghi]|uniref:Putative signal peptide protein n=1 Tax=Puccinia sorghi TaxID=27349 RepID=A0A0L6VR68_9BASI|nr:putative signal peptide protein [Puccinia sorghi]